MNNIIDNSGFRRSFYGQTGLQFKTNIIAESSLYDFDIGISGVGADNSELRINFHCSYGKIYDNNGRFVGSYIPNELFSISGNILDTKYDYFINDRPVSYNNSKNTGILNHFYIRKNQNANIEYDFYVSGPSIPSLYSSNIILSTGSTGTGYIINNSSTPIIIYNGLLSNFSSNSSIQLDNLFTGLLTTSGSYNIISNNSQVKTYEGNLKLNTNIGEVNIISLIDVTGEVIPTEFSIDLFGSNTIYTNQTNNYFANTTSLPEFNNFDIPLLVSLQHISGSGNHYKYIDISTGFDDTYTTFITREGYITAEVTGIGSGQGGYLNNIATGFVSGIITGTDYVYATGTFVWNYNTPVTGCCTGIGYTGLGTGMYYGLITGTISAGSGVFNYFEVTGSRYIDWLNAYNSLAVPRTLDNLYNSGPTGFQYNTGVLHWDNFNYGETITFNRPTTLSKTFIYQPNFSIFTSNPSLNNVGLYFKNATGLVNLINFYYSNFKVSGGLGTYNVSPNNQTTGEILITGVFIRNSHTDPYDYYNVTTITSNNPYFYSEPSVIYGGTGIGIGTISCSTITGKIYSTDIYGNVTLVSGTNNPSGNVRGLYSHTFTGSGYFTGSIEQYLYSSGLILDFSKEFTGLWNLRTGANSSDLVDYRNLGFYNLSKTNYENSYPANYRNSSLTIDVKYTNDYTTNDNNRDVVLLTVSGYNLNSGLSIYITGNY